MSTSYFVTLNDIDCDDSTNYDGTKVRRFRNSLPILRDAVISFHEHNNVCNMLLGDIVGRYLVRAVFF